MQNLKFTHVGYEQYIASDISVIFGRENFLNVEMREAVVNLNEVAVGAEKSSGRPLNSMATVSARQLTTEDAGRYTI
jgi:hypothetical protein